MTVSVASMRAAEQLPELSDFGNDPWWLVLLKAVAVFAMLMLMVIFTIWFERRVVAKMQHRLGPIKAPLWGISQGLFDGFKLALKEQILPKAVDKPIYLLAPVISTACAFVAFAVIPFGGTVSIFGHETTLQLTDFPVAVLYVVAIASIGIYGLVLAGWSSGSTYPLLGGLRSTAQMISYEVAMSLSFVAVFLYAGSMSTSEIVSAQQNVWFAITLLPSFVIYTISMVGETNRAPFDLPEAEGELVAGFHTEYSSLAFAVFFLAEYINMITVSALAATLFLGGYQAPWPITALWPGDGSPNEGWWPLLWWTGKVFMFLFVFVWLRGTLPRMRYDQFMKFGWKVLIPIALAWTVVVATMEALRNEGVDRTEFLPWVGASLVLLLAAYLWWDNNNRRRQEQVAAELSASEPPFDPFAGGHPVPPLPEPSPLVEAAPVGQGVTRG